MLFLATWWACAIVEATRPTFLETNEPQTYEVYGSYYYDMPVGSILGLDFNQSSLQ